MTERIDLMREGELAALALQRDRTLFHWFSAVAGIVSVVFGILLFVHEGNSVLGIIEMSAGVLAGVNAAALHVHHRLWPAKTLLALIVLVTLCATLSTGGIGGTGIYWWFMYPSAAFFLGGRRGGVVLSVIMALSSVVIYVLGEAGIIPAFYAFIEFRQMWAVTAVVAILSYVKESERQQTQIQVAEQRQSMRTLLENLPAGVILFAAPSGRPIGANSVAERLLGCAVDADTELSTFPGAHGLRKEDGMPYPPEDFPVADSLHRGVESSRANVFVERKNGEKAVLRVSSAPVRSEEGDIVSVVAVLEDATSEHEIDVMKSEFVSLAGNQLKMPLAGVKWSVQALLGGDAGELTAEQRSHVNRIDTISSQLSRLVSDLLNVSRIETGRKFNLTSVPVDATAMIAKVIAGEAISGIASRRRVGVVTALPKELSILVDEAKVKAVFAILISNAVKYAKDGGTVTIGARKIAKDEAVLYVKDDGIGIPEQQKRRIFEKFYRADNVSEKSEGTGLGLYLARAIVEKHGGRIWFESEEGKGTTFYLALPRPPIATASPTK